MNEKKTQTVLITGAGGFLASELIKQLSETRDSQIMALTSNKDNLLRMFDFDKRILCFDIEDWKNMKLPWKKINTIVHCAFARTSYGGDVAKSLNFTNELFQEALKEEVPSIINISSRSVYGQAQNTPWTEKTMVDPESLYALAKYSSEIITNNIGGFSKNKTRTTNIRLGSLIGNCSNQRITTKFVNNAIRNQTIQIVGGKQVFSYLDVRDAAAGIIALLSFDSSQWKKVYNLGSNDSYGIIEVANIVVETAKYYTNNQIKIEIDEKEIHLDAEMDSSLFYNDTQWEPRYKLKDTIESLFKYLIKQM